jgi:porphobilinogen synthase
MCKTFYREESQMTMEILKEMLRRPRRNRLTEGIRSLVQETRLSPSDLVAPFFLLDGERRKEEIPTLPGIYRQSLDLVLKEAEQLHSKGMRAVALFPKIPQEQKDPFGSLALHPEGIIPRAIRTLKEKIPSLLVIADIALDPYTSHGHDGILGEGGIVHNDATVEILVQMALLYARCQIDIVAPSDMMDGRVKAIRKALDQEFFENVSILSYTAKYASSLYAPFRDALGSKLQSGDKKSYQMNPANVREALIEAKLDEEEGADILMVKPALYYLDVIAKMRAASNLPICAYHVSGEYAMVMAADQLGFLNAQQAFYEGLLSIKRAGADFIISYATPQLICNCSALR